MGKLRSIRPPALRFQGSSLIEVIVASVIILIAFLLFSTMINTLYNSRSSIRLLEVLFANKCKGCEVETISTETYKKQKIYVGNVGNSTILHTGYSIKTSPADSVFQK